MATQSSAKEKTRSKIKEPKHYNVIMLNDDFTTMEFVVEILMSVFGKNQAEAEKLMMFVHLKGRAIAGCYPLDIANTKVSISMTRAKEQGYPFRMLVEEA